MNEFMRKLVRGAVAATLLLGSSWAMAERALYVDAGLGGYSRDLRHNSVIGAQNRSNTWKHGRLGWQAGLDVGYQFKEAWAVEVGFFSIQDQKMTFDSAATYSGTSFAAGSNITFKTWGTYAVGRLTVPITVDWDVYAKLGLGYVRSKVTYSPLSSAATTGSGHVWTPVFGVGLNYLMGDHWAVGFDYAVFLGNSVRDDPYYSSQLAGSHVHVPSLQRITMNVGYLFEL